MKNSISFYIKSYLIFNTFIIPCYPNNLFIQKQFIINNDEGIIKNQLIEDQEFYNWLLQQNDIYFISKIESEYKNNNPQFGIIIRAFSEFIKKNPNDLKELYNNIDTILNDNHSDLEKRKIYVFVLGQAGTIPALKILLNLYEAGINHELLPALANSIQKISFNFKIIDGDEITRQLISFWKIHKNEKIANPIAIFLARIGNNDGVEVLIDGIIDNNNTNSYYNAYNALEIVKNKNVINLINEKLQNFSYDDRRSILYPTILINIDTSESINLLVEWCKNIPNDVNEEKYKILRNIKSEKSWEQINMYINNDVIFKNQKILFLLKKPEYKITKE